MADLLFTLSIVAFCIAGAFLILAIALRFLFRIPLVIGDLSGRTARKSIEQLRANNERTGNKSHRPSKVNAKRGKITSNMQNTGGSPKKGGKSKTADPNATMQMRGTDPNATMQMGGTDPNATMPMRGADPNATMQMGGTDPNATMPMRGADPNATMPLRATDPNATVPLRDPNATMPLRDPNATMPLNTQPQQGQAYRQPGQRPDWGDNGDGPAILDRIWPAENEAATEILGAASVPDHTDETMPLNGATARPGAIQLTMLDEVMLIHTSEVIP